MRYLIVLSSFLIACNWGSDPSLSLAEDVVEFINKGKTDLIERSLMSEEQSRRIMKYDENIITAKLSEQMRKDLLKNIYDSVEKFRKENKIASPSNFKIKSVEFIHESVSLGKLFIEIYNSDFEGTVQFSVAKDDGTLYLISPMKIAKTEKSK